MSIKRFSKSSKRILVGTLAASMCLSTAVWANMNQKNTAAKSLYFGDIDGNGNVTLDDASKVLNFALAIEKPTAEQIRLCDANKDGLINLDDTLEVLKIALAINPATTIEPMETAKPTTQPDKTSAPVQTSPAQVTNKPIVPSPDQTPYPTGPSIPIVSPGAVVTGTSIQSLDESASLNGATVEEGVYTITDQNKAANTGIQLMNPWKNKKELNQSVEDALPVYFKDGSNNLIAKVNGNELLSLDGKSVIGTVTRADENAATGAAVAAINVTEAVHIVTSASKAETKVLDAEINGTIEKWNISMIPSEARVEGQYNANYKECYAKPQWNNGLSVSFWVKSDWQNPLLTDASPIFVIRNSSGCDNVKQGEMSKSGHTDDFAFMLRLNGGVSYEGDMTGNCFKAQNYTVGNNNKWNYYTVTFANDWITVYVNGQELVYYNVEMSKKNIGYLNNGFLSRYSPAYEIKKEDDTEPRKYLKSGWVDNSGKELDTLHIEYSVIGNSRYANPASVTTKKTGGTHPLLIDSFTGENTEIWIGNPKSTSCTALHSENMGWVNKNFVSTGTQFTDITTYEKELTAAEVAANYEKSREDNAEKLSLDSED